MEGKLSNLKKIEVECNFIGSSFEQDSETCMSSDITSPHSVSQLEFPTPERLLPVGPQRDFPSLVERVRQALDISDIEGLYALILGLNDKPITNIHTCI